MIARPDHLTVRPNLARRWSKAQPILQIDDKIGSSDLPVGRFVDRRVESYFWFSEKYFCSHAPQIRSRTLASHPTRGAYHDRHGRGEGCGGRSSVGRAMRAQGGLLSVSG